MTTAIYGRRVIALSLYNNNDLITNAMYVKPAMEKINSKLINMIASMTKYIDAIMIANVITFTMALILVENVKEVNKGIEPG